MGFHWIGSSSSSSSKGRDLIVLLSLSLYMDVCVSLCVQDLCIYIKCIEDRGQCWMFSTITVYLIFKFYFKFY